MDNEQRQTRENDPTRRSHTLLWVLLSLFIVLAVGGMWAIDYFYSPEMLQENTLQDAAGK